MVEVLLFYVELYVTIYVAVRQWQRQGWRYGILAAALSGIAFIVLWALISPLARLVYTPSTPSLLVQSDTLGVIVTVAAHLTFVWAYFFGKPSKHSSTTAESA